MVRPMRSHTSSKSSLRSYRMVSANTASSGLITSCFTIQPPTVSSKPFGNSFPCAQHATSSCIRLSAHCMQLPYGDAVFVYQPTVSVLIHLGWTDYSPWNHQRLARIFNNSSVPYSWYARVSSSFPTRFHGCTTSWSVSTPAQASALSACSNVR